jgi:hypothetical protein
VIATVFRHSPFYGEVQSQMLLAVTRAGRLHVHKTLESRPNGVHDCQLCNISVRNRILEPARELLISAIRGTGRDFLFGIRPHHRVQDEQA